jgi:hypothetical protein
LVSHVNGRNSLRVFYSTVLWKTFGHKWERVARDWRQVHDDELHGLYKSLNFALVIKARVTRWAQKCVEGFVGEIFSKETTCKTLA